MKKITIITFFMALFANITFAAEVNDSVQDITIQIFNFTKNLQLKLELK